MDNKSLTNKSCFSHLFFVYCDLETMIEFSNKITVVTEEINNNFIGLNFGNGCPIINFGHVCAKEVKFIR